MSQLPVLSSSHLPHILLELPFNILYEIYTTYITLLINAKTARTIRPASACCHFYYPNMMCLKPYNITIIILSVCDIIIQNIYNALCVCVPTIIHPPTHYIYIQYITHALCTDEVQKNRIYWHFYVLMFYVYICFSSALKSTIYSTIYVYVVYLYVHVVQMI